MKKLIVLIFLSMSFCSINAQINFPPPPEVMLLGKQPFSALKGNADFAWFDSGVMSYPPTPAYIDSLKKIKKPYTLYVLGGTWCDDTQKLLPQLYAVLKTYGKNVDTEVTLYFVDRDKKSPEGTETKYDLKNVPTIIVLDKTNTEIGRIVESVKISVEADLLQILKKIK
jgi:thiol-disulfide isomerase/thioredoxin